MGCAESSSSETKLQKTKETERRGSTEPTANPPSDDHAEIAIPSREENVQTPPPQQNTDLEVENRRLREEVKSLKAQLREFKQSEGGQDDPLSHTPLRANPGELSPIERTPPGYIRNASASLKSMRKTLPSSRRDHTEATTLTNPLVSPIAIRRNTETSLDLTGDVTATQISLNLTAAEIPTAATDEWASGWSSKKSSKQRQDDQRTNDLSVLRSQPKPKGYKMKLQGGGRKTGNIAAPTPSTLPPKLHCHHREVEGEEDDVEWDETASVPKERRPLKSSMKKNSMRHRLHSPQAASKNNAEDLHRQWEEREGAKERESQEALTHLLDTVLVSEPLTRLDLGEFVPDLRGEDDEFRVVCQAVRQHQRHTLVELDLRRCPNLGDSSVPLIVALIDHISTLRSVRFIEANFSVPCERQLYAAVAPRSELKVRESILLKLAPNSTDDVTYLDLRNKGLGDKTILQVCAAAQQLGVIHYSQRKLAQATGERNNASTRRLVRTLDVRDNEITESSGEALLELVELGEDPNWCSGLVTVLASGNTRVRSSTLEKLTELNAERKRSYLALGDPCGE